MGLLRGQLLCGPVQDLVADDFGCLSGRLAYA